MKLSAFLPRDAAMALLQAAETPITRYDPLARVKAIEKVTERIKAQYPHLYKEQQNESQTK